MPASAKLAGKDFPKYFVSKKMPVWDPAARGIWRLEVSGAVRTPLSLTLDDLMKLPHITQKVDHFCVEGWNARAEWTGVRVSDIARVAGITADAHYVDFQSFDDDYHESWDMESAMHPQTLVAYGMDGHLLGPAHGAPARVHSPIKLGYKNTKYLTKIVFMPKKNGGYWSDQGYEWYGGNLSGGTDGHSQRRGPSVRDPHRERPRAPPVHPARQRARARAYRSRR